MIILDLKIIFCSETKTQFQFCYAKCKEVRNTVSYWGRGFLYGFVGDFFENLVGSKLVSNFMIQSSTVYIVPSDQNWGAVSGEFQIKSEQPMISGAKVQPSLVQFIECKLLGTGGL